MRWGMKTYQLDASLSGEPPVMTIDLRGELTGFDSDALSNAHGRATEQGAQSIILNFADVDFMNSGGIGRVLGVLFEAKPLGQRLIFAGLAPHYLKIMTMMGLTRHVEVYSTVAEARLAMAPPV